MSKIKCAGPFATIPHKIIRDKNLSPSEYKLFMILFSYCDLSNGENRCRVVQKLLADDMGCSDRQVRKLLSSLASKSYLIIHTNTEKTKGSSNMYEIPFSLFIGKFNFGEAGNE